jgi:hypothetical protein
VRNPHNPAPELDATSLYRANAPPQFWRLCGRPEPTANQWELAVRAAAAELPGPARALGDDIQSLLYQTLGEAQFGPDHYRLSPAKRLYYSVKPVLPRKLTRPLRRLRGRMEDRSARLQWPAEPRFARFQWRVVRELLGLMGRPALSFIHFWPQGRPFAFVLTHDIETEAGQAHARAVADLDAGYGFRSSFNFVPERYRVDHRLVDELRGRGFEIGVHGLKHDGKLFRSAAEFRRGAERINHYLREFQAVGFRAELTHRHPQWMQALQIDYDLSFFDTDPYEAIPGGTMSLWPVYIGRFLELPYTLLQDYTLLAVLKETTPRLWLEKIEMIRSFRGLALVNTHPDYLQSRSSWRLYEAFLRTMRNRADYWHALPCEVARWWRARAEAAGAASLEGAVEGVIEASDVAEQWQPMAS